MITILLVEDADAVRQFMAVALLRLGYEVIEARTFAEATARFEAAGNRVSLLLSDVVLPDGTGPELYQLLVTANPRLRLLLTSGYPVPDLVPLVGDTPVGDILYKPFTVATLEAKVRAVLSKD
jgi:DNA-binding NtrC family response regulator